MLWEFFIPALVDSNSLESERQASSFQDSSQYSGRSLCCRLDGHHLFSYFQVLQSLYRSFNDCTGRSNYKWYHRHFHVPKFFSSLAMPWYLSFCFLSVLPGGRLERHCRQFSRSSFLFTITRSSRLVEIKWSVCKSKSQRILCVSFF